MTQEELKEYLSYNSETGIFSWLVKTSRGTRVWRPAGTLVSTGYIVIRINNIPYYAHRLAWLYVYGKWPDGLLDHKNQCRSDNKINNLREATSSQNQRNRDTGIGVSYNKAARKYRAYTSGKHLGSFTSFDEAKTARDKAMEFIHPEYAPNKEVENDDRKRTADEPKATQLDQLLHRVF